MAYRDGVRVSFQTAADLLGTSKWTVRRVMTAPFSLGVFNYEPGVQRHFTCEVGSWDEFERRFEVWQEERAANQRAGRTIMVQSSSSVRTL